MLHLSAHSGGKQVVLMAITSNLMFRKTYVQPPVSYGREQIVHLQFHLGGNKCSNGHSSNLSLETFSNPPPMWVGRKQMSRLRFIFETLLGEKARVPSPVLCWRRHTFHWQSLQIHAGENKCTFSDLIGVIAGVIPNFIRERLVF